MSRGAVGALAGVALAALIIRAAIVLAIDPAIVVTDSREYISAARHSLYGDVLHPAGYSIFLRVLDVLGLSLRGVAIVQHLLAFAAAALFVWCWRIGVGRPLLPAGAAGIVLILGWDQVVASQAILSDALFSALVLGALGTLVAARAGRTGPLLVAGGVGLGVATCVRTVGWAVLAVAICWAFLAVGDTWRRRAAVAAVVAMAAAIPLSAYLIGQGTSTGEWHWSESAGISAWGRATRFADCGRFTPPKGTEQLCDPRPTRERPDVRYYWFSPESPLARLDGSSVTAGDHHMGRFGRAAILQEPSAYAQTVAADFRRFFFPSSGRNRPFASQGPVENFGPETGAVDPATAAVLNAEYGIDRVHMSSFWRSLRELRLIRFHEWLLLACLFLGLFGFAIPGTHRAPLGLLLASGLALLVFPVATQLYAPRYVIPAQPLFAASGVSGALAIVALLAGYRRNAVKRDAIATPGTRHIT